jgi:acylphosphatase
MISTKHLIVHGRVQGVYFRASMCREAAILAVTGWVRNRQDGSLEAMLQGETASVEQLIDWTRRGPPGARVERIEISDGQGSYKEFNARPTH